MRICEKKMYVFGFFCLMKNVTKTKKQKTHTHTKKTTKKKDGLMLVYDITDQNTLNSLKRWRDDFYKHYGQLPTDKDSFPIVVCANKSDMVCCFLYYLFCVFFLLVLFFFECLSVYVFCMFRFVFVCVLSLKSTKKPKIQPIFCFFFFSFRNCENKRKTKKNKKIKKKSKNVGYAYIL